MKNISHSLKIKYGLRQNPNQNQINDWVERTDSYRAEGKEPEAAGRIAASEIFDDFMTIFYGSEADTIVALLNEARKK